MSTSYFSELVNVTLFGRRFFADVIKGLGMKRSSWITRVDSKSKDKCSYKKQKRPIHRHTREGDVKMEAEM